ncbi:MAG: hypothetical protein A2283_07355 [Lentisphaerae bacterium RIFOXYA12_FULL_48_11]|nr:MAG: hypothetical protein A2283_07355 [Lentisphaerae bacterium RIFOXYA12_FULL_48_11]
MGKECSMFNLYTKRDLEGWAYLCLVGAAFSCGFSPVVAGRTFLGISTVLLLVHAVKSKRFFCMPWTGWLWLAFIAVAVFATAVGASPSRGFGNMPKLFWFVGIPLCATLVTTSCRLSDILRAYAVGAGVASLRVIIFNPFHALRDVKSGFMPDFMTAFVNLGSMDYAQIFMLGIVITLGFIFLYRRENKSAILWWLLLLLLTTGLLVMFKRGSWVCACVVVTLFVAFKTNWKYLLILAIVVISTVALPPVRARIAAVKEEWNVDKGGRMTMWFKIAPALRKQYPLGIGYQVLTNEMMKKIYRGVEPDRKHLHSNIVQVLVDTGWLGLIIYLLWMGKALVDGGMLIREARGLTGCYEMFPMVLFLLLIALLLNGLVEYNFGRAPIVPAYGLIVGCIAGGRRFLSSQSPL